MEGFTVHVLGMERFKMQDKEKGTWHQGSRFKVQDKDRGTWHGLDAFKVKVCLLGNLAGVADVLPLHFERDPAT